MNRLEIEQQALEDLKEAVLWYENQQDTIGLRLIQEVKKTLQFIVKNPKHYKKQAKNYRQAKVDTFPFVIVFEDISDRIIVYRIFHTSRKPKNKF